MALLLSLVCCFMLIIGLIYENKIYNPLTLFNGLWAIILFGAHFELLGLTGVTYLTYFIIFIGLVSFFLGHFTVKLVVNNKRFYEKKPKKLQLKESNSELNNIYKVLLILSIIVGMITASSSLTLLAQGYTLHDLRYVIGMERYSPLLNILYSYLVKPFTILLIPISAYYVFKEKRNLNYFYAASILITLNIVTDGGRFILLYVIINYIIAFIILNKNKNLFFGFKKKLPLYLIVIISISFILYITLARDSAVFESIYIYLVGGVPHLSYRLELLNNFTSYTYGFTSLQGFIRPLFVFLESIGVYSVPEIVNNAEKLRMDLEDPVYIGEGVLFNAFVTLFYYFYVDLGIAGVILGSYLYGFIASMSYSQMLAKINLFNVTMYLLIVQSLLLSMVRFQFSSFGFALSFVYLFIIISHIKIRKSKTILDINV